MKTKYRLNFLLDTAEYYNSKNRAIGKDKLCVYSCTNESEGCAIGRFLTKAMARKFDNYSNSSIQNNEIFNSLPEDLRNLGQDFLLKIQELHDGKSYWTLKGLSSDGKTKVQNIKNKFYLFEI